MTIKTGTLKDTKKNILKQSPLSLCSITASVQVCSTIIDTGSFDLLPGEHEGRAGGIDRAQGGRGGGSGQRDLAIGQRRPRRLSRPSQSTIIYKHSPTIWSDVRSW